MWKKILASVTIGLVTIAGLIFVALMIRNSQILAQLANKEAAQAAAASNESKAAAPVVQGVNSESTGNYKITISIPSLSSDPGVETLRDEVSLYVNEQMCSYSYITQLPDGRYQILLNLGAANISYYPVNVLYVFYHGAKSNTFNFDS